MHMSWEENHGKDVMRDFEENASVGTKACLCILHVLNHMNLSGITTPVESYMNLSGITTHVESYMNLSAITTHVESYMKLSNITIMQCS